MTATYLWIKHTHTHHTQTAFICQTLAMSFNFCFAIKQSKVPLASSCYYLGEIPSEVACGILGKCAASQTGEWCYGWEEQQQWCCTADGHGDRWPRERQYPAAALSRRREPLIGGGGEAAASVPTLTMASAGCSARECADLPVLLWTARFVCLKWVSCFRNVSERERASFCNGLSDHWALGELHSPETTRLWPPCRVPAPLTRVSRANCTSVPTVNTLSALPITSGQSPVGIALTLNTICPLRRAAHLVWL